MHFTISTSTFARPEKGWVIKVAQGSRVDRERLRNSDLGFFLDDEMPVHGKGQPWTAMCDVADFVENELGDGCTFEIE